MLIFIYNLIFLVLTPMFVTRIFFKAIGDSSYLMNLKNRFGVLSTSMEPGLESIWFHSVSLGEVISSSDLVRNLSKDYKVILTKLIINSDDSAKVTHGSSITHLIPNPSL